MIRALISALAIAASAAVPAAAADPSPAAREAVAALAPYQPMGQVKGEIRLWGHGSFKRDFVGQLVQRWFTEFKRYQPGVTLDYRMYGTASAIGALATGAGNLALLGEEINPDAERTFVRVHGYAPAKIEIANGSVQANYFDYAHMIFVHRDNPLARLSRPQLEAIFGAEHRCTKLHIRTWGDLGLTGDWAKRSITPHGWKTDTDFALFFRERVLCNSHRWNLATREYLPTTKADGTAYDLGQQIVDALAKDRYGIAISNVRFVNPDVKPLALAWTAKGPYVDATDATLIGRTYPLVRIIPAYIDHAPGKPIDPVVREFLRYILSREGQQALIEDSAYLPLSPTDAAREGRLLR